MVPAEREGDGGGQQLVLEEKDSPASGLVLEIGVRGGAQQSSGEQVELSSAT